VLILLPAACKSTQAFHSHSQPASIQVEPVVITVPALQAAPREFCSLPGRQCSLHHGVGLWQAVCNRSGDAATGSSQRCSLTSWRLSEPAVVYACVAAAVCWVNVAPVPMSSPMQHSASPLSGEKLTALHQSCPVEFRVGCAECAPTGHTY
jgi:hypothetical protein